MSPILIIIISLLFSAFFSGMEIAFISSNRLKFELDRKHGHLSSRFIGIFLKNPGHYIATMLVGNNIALVVYGFFVSLILEPVLIYRMNIRNEILLLILLTIAGTLVILFTAEFIPKAIFRSRPNLSLNIFAIPVFVVYVLLYIPTLIVIWITRLVMRYMMGIKVNMKVDTQKTVFGMVDLDHLVTESQSVLEHHMDEEPEKKIFQNALEFSKLKVRDCMVPRTEIEALEVETAMEELIERFVETGYSKILVYRETIDNIIGYIPSKELFKKPGNISDKLVSMTIVPETMNVNKLFRKLIKDQKSIALVVDEYGGTSGIITLEDIIEEIFGEIEDEHDTIEFVERIINEKEFIFSGRLEIDYINEKYNLELPESEEYDTLAGFIIHHYENIPKLNTRVVIGNYQFRILKVSDTKIYLVQVKKLPEV